MPAGTTKPPAFEGQDAMIEVEWWEYDDAAEMAEAFDWED